MATTKGSNIINLGITLGDMVLMCVLMYLCIVLIPAYVPYSIQHAPRSAFVLACLSVLVSAYISPNVMSNRKLKLENLVKRNALATLVTMAFFGVSLRLMTHGGDVIAFCVRFSVLLFVATLSLRFVEKVLLSKIRMMGYNSRSVVLVGSDPAVLHIYRAMTQDSSGGYLVKGYFSNDEVLHAPAELKKLGSRDDLKRIMQQEAMGNSITGDNNIEVYAEELYCCLSHDETESIKEIIDYCNRKIIHFFYVPRMMGNIRMSLKPESFGDMVIYTNYYEPLSYLSNRMIKRGFDIIVSSVVLLLMLPFLPIVALIIKLQSPGPLFFAQERTGLGGGNFTCYKFRSMHVNADADRVQATKDDPRKFAFGNFMRKTNIDEFPQFFNVLKGDMSIVGPRPHMLYHTEKYSALINKYMVRHFSKPGITGYAQVTGFRGETEELWQMEGRVERDIWYIENWSLWLDIKIIFRTAWSIVHPDKEAY